MPFFCNPFAGYSNSRRGRRQTRQHMNDYHAQQFQTRMQEGNRRRVSNARRRVEHWDWEMEDAGRQRELHPNGYVPAY
jgi:hypothetical protein